MSEDPSWSAERAANICPVFRYITGGQQALRSVGQPPVTLIAKDADDYGGEASDVALLLRHEQLHEHRRNGSDFAADAIEARAVEVIPDQRRRRLTDPRQNPVHPIWPDDRRTELARRYTAGEPLRQLAAHFGMQLSSLHSYRRRWGVPARRPKSTAAKGTGI